MTFARLVGISVALALPSVTYAQIFALSPVRQQMWSFDIGGQLAQPVGGFRANVARAWGMGGTMRYNVPRFSSLGLRADFAMLNYGNETKRVPLSPTLNRVMVDMTTSNNIALVTGGPELAIRHGWLQPYVYGFAGYSNLFTQSSAEDDDESGAFATSTNFSDGGLAVGWGGGVRMPLSFRSVDASIDLGARLTRNGPRRYLRPGDIRDLSDGSLLFTPRSTDADFWQYHVGMSFSPRRR